jgi:hypothetical protein
MLYLFLYFTHDIGIASDRVGLSEMPSQEFQHIAFTLLYRYSE